MIQKIILSVCLYDRPRANLVKNKRFNCNHGNDDCYTNLHVQRFASAILIDFVVITLCLTCFTFISALSSVVTNNTFDLIKTDYQRYIRIILASSL